MIRMKSLIVALCLVASPMFAADAADGAALFKTHCASCHGADGKGRSPIGKSLHVKDLASDDVQKKTGEELEKIISDGEGKMPPYKSKLHEEDIDALVKFIRTLAPKK